MTPTDFKQARQSLGLTQAQTAAMVGRKTRNVQQWEAGDRAVDQAAALLVAAYLAGYRPADWPTR